MRIFKRKNKISYVRSKGEIVLFACVFVFFILYAAALVYPVVWGFLSSLKEPLDYLSDNFGLPKFPLKFRNYIDAFELIQDEASEQTFLGMFWNSLWFAGGSAIINMEFVSAYAYVLNKYKFRGRNFLYGLCLFMMAVPIGASFVSTYRLMYRLHLNDSYLILLTSCSVYGMNLMLFYSYYSNISWSYAEAAQMDGANFYQIYFQTMRPQAMPMAFTLGLLQFIGKWNDYMSPLLYLESMPTLATGLYKYQSVAERSGDYPLLFAGLIICLIPIMILFGIFSEKLMQNINIGGLKG